ncbi:hypothetical protein COU87_01040 [Candidatus Roizmanbacteria bacterium CG10_big_fil_rev_8_21_14_0_10_39_12]|uniref:Uncharacterized protein n=1 Tax=Candidatus Roizmanbacteria bacterium CG10_big_fil_rev_8_21_14_0_10_39_12 TaxID=1974852 RepID=A0A2M8KQ92_9BACT|nr:MAG: hypothetical protein COY15_00110 [Candidatus Roizmanbacteria bacterium CG_4_10_14_0_2_um_filter_39_12]PJE62096.1 MAG: hypothetical protein COU87_01040 [Candidatus Roizmanbacteria bacterium CG10_big_fil_rev_8_21_14_0_10_39_12]
MAISSLFIHIAYLFTFESNHKIPHDTNAPEAHFKHTNEVGTVNCGLKRPAKKKLISTILLASTMAPTKEKIKKIFG